MDIEKLKKIMCNNDYGIAIMQAFISYTDSPKS